MTTTILVGDVRSRLNDIPAGTVQMVCTSPPYFGLRRYLPDDHADKPQEIGLEPSLADYISNLVDVFRSVRRVLRDDGTVWLNIGDSYAGGGNGSRDAERWPKQSCNNNGDRATHAKKGTGLPAKSLMMVPSRLAIALQDDGWLLRSQIIWAKKAPMPESVKDRPTSAHESIFLFAKTAKYFYDDEAVREENSENALKEHRPGTRRPVCPKDATAADDDRNNISAKGTIYGVGGRNQRNVWHLGPEPFAEAHFATFPTEIPRRCIKAGSRPGDTVLDIFCGSGTTGLVADQLGRNSILVDINPAYAEMARERITGDAPMFASVEVDAA